MEFNDPTKYLYEIQGGCERADRRYSTDLQIKQVAGTVEITSENITRIYRPAGAKRHMPKSGNGEGAQRRSGQPPLCGWSAKTLVVLGGDSEDDRLPVEQHYGISEDGQRFVEVVGIKGHMDGFTMSRVWDRTQ